MKIPPRVLLTNLDHFPAVDDSTLAEEWNDNFDVAKYSLLQSSDVNTGLLQLKNCSRTADNEQNYIGQKEFSCLELHVSKATTPTKYRVHTHAGSFSDDSLSGTHTSRLTSSIDEAEAVYAFIFEHLTVCIALNLPW